MDTVSSLNFCLKNSDQLIEHTLWRTAQLQQARRNSSILRLLAQGDKYQHSSFVGCEECCTAKPTLLSR